ncbi:MAG: hypothetical protein ABW321_33285 [Polyangiales bacterium]
MIIGAHSVIYSRDPEADSAFLKEVLGLPHVEVGHGWLIFGLPPAEVAVHPAEGNTGSELYLMTHDVEALLTTLELRSLETTPVQDEGWGLVTHVTLPSGTKLPIYQPQHARPEPVSAPKRRAASAKKKAGRKVAKKAVKKASKAPKAGKRAGKTAVGKAKAKPAKKKRGR